MGQRCRKVTQSDLWRPTTWGSIQTFRHFKPLTQKLIIASLLAGLILGAYFIKSDLSNDSWWDGKSFTPNLLAALTGFLFGAPIALVILATFTKEREDQAALERVNRLSKHGWYTFRDLVLAYCSEERYSILSDQARQVTDLYNRIATILDSGPDPVDSLIAAYAGDERVAKYDAQAKILSLNLYTAEREFRNAINKVTNEISAHFRLESEWAQVVGAWRTLDQYIRLQRLEQGLEWIEADIDSELQKWMSSYSNPLKEFMDLHEVRKYSRNPFPSIETMRDSLDTVSVLARMNASDRSAYGNPLDKGYSTRYATYRDSAQLFIIDLVRNVKLVEQANWPEIASKPSATPEYEATNERWIGSLATDEGRVAFEQEVRKILAIRYHEKLRRRPKGNRSGSDLRR